MKIVVSTHQGVVFNEEVDYILIHNEDGEFGILKNHVPVVAVINDGFVKVTSKTKSYFVSLCGAMFEFHENSAVVLAQEAKVADSLKEANELLIYERNKRIESNKKESVDFTKKERELREHLKNAKAGEL
jgi:F-type H+-transporting ATPase subunit epsilon